MTDSDFRIGHGFDVHRFAATPDPSRPLKLAGHMLPVSMTLEAHSDGDVILHAVCDAVLGAIGAGDIGEHFPDTDEAFAGADSALLLSRVLGLAAERGFAPVNVDVTVIAQAPKLAPYRADMRASLADLLRLDPMRVNLKATTTERLGAIGREEGMACHCVLLMRATDSND